MPKKRETHVTKSDDASADLRAALDRLRRGRPLHPELAKLRLAGRLRISIASVAKEANRSRTLVGSHDCAYPDVRKEILAAAAVDTSEPSTPREARKTAQEVILSLREEIKILKHEKAILATRVQDAVNVARALERKLEKAERRVSRMEDRLTHPEQVVGRRKPSGNVIPLMDKS